MEDEREQAIGFREADRSYAELKRRRDAGNMGADEFEERLKQLMVQDTRGVWWAKSRTTGEWHYHEDNAWVKSIPPYEESKVQDEPETPFHKPSISDLTEICAGYRNRNLYVGGAIPHGLLANARSLFPIPKKELVAALVDSSTWRSSGFGFAICEEGLRWRDDRPSNGFVQWLDFADVSIEAHRTFGSRSQRIEIGRANDYYLRARVMDSRFLVDMLGEIQSLVRTPPATEET